MSLPVLRAALGDKALPVARKSTITLYIRKHGVDLFGVFTYIHGIGGKPIRMGQ